jgi:hypothetical protein
MNRAGRGATPRRPGPCLLGAAGRVLALLGLALLTGCLSRPALVTQYYALQHPPVATPSAASGSGTLALRAVEVSPLFDCSSLVYRTSDAAYERDPYAELLVPPARGLAIPVRDWLRRSGLFKDIIEAGSLLHPDCWAEVYVSELYGDFRQPEKPAAVLSMRFIFFGGGDASAQRVSFQKEYTRSIALRRNTAGEVVAGWNQALAEILNNLASDLRAAPGQSSPPK